MVGPFIFFDHLGPAEFPPGRGVDVRPHPHIHLATVTYLFDGVLLHRDSLGSVQEIHPGAVNWMTAGRGITHSERSPADRSQPRTLHGIQTWVALPEEAEDIEPSFHHHPTGTLPTWKDQGVSVTLIAGTTHGYTSPVQVFSPMIYLDLQFAAGGEFFLDAAAIDRAVYSVTGGISVDGTPLAAYQLAILKPGIPVAIAADVPSRCIVVGGEPLGTRIKWWNFVSSRAERIEQAKADWKAGRFPTVPGETEWIPLPESV
jgi:redox-sensitive bicupin YhaK (pirin superfamily)